MKCNACGKRVSKKSGFCEYCGSKQIVEYTANPVYIKLQHMRKQIFLLAIPVITIALLYMVASSAALLFLYRDHQALMRKGNATSELVEGMHSDLQKIQIEVDKNTKLLGVKDFKIGSTKDEVKAAMGVPDSIKPYAANYSETLMATSNGGLTGKEEWTYGKSKVIFYAEIVHSYSDLGKNLKIKE